MARCSKCGKGGIFFKVGLSGMCEVCEEKTAYEEHKRVDWESYCTQKDTDWNQYLAHKAQVEKEVAEYETLLSDQKKLYGQLVEKAEKEALAKAQTQLDVLNSQRSNLQIKVDTVSSQLAATTDELKDIEKKATSESNRIQKAKELLKSIRYSITRLSNMDDGEITLEDEALIAEAEEFLLPTVELKLQCMNVRQLRKEYTKNQRLIKELLAKYSKRYTTKANQAIYRLMVIALEAELQNVLYNIGYGKLDKAVSNVKMITDKYQKIATDGNQNIAPTIKRFIGEVEYLFIRAVEIEYEYYVQKERAKEEQRAIREQMRQEAAERKELERQRKHIEKEESKYTAEMQTVSEQIRNEPDSDKIKLLEERLARLQEQLAAVNETKEEILKLQTGKAGNVYIISNLGSFGDKVFKIGMTRRLDPFERVRELGSASVPFPFDVHSFIFSDDAVGLEASLHKRLHTQRVNKINLRKEFFEVSVDELEDLVYELEPSAEFNRTLLAEQYNQSLSVDEIPEEYSAFDFDEDDDEPEDVLDDAEE